jgi:hypothetical protein
MEPQTEPKNDWITTKWRPMMAMQYMAVCLFDFIISPMLWSMIQLIGDGKLEMQWVPLTLQGAGFYHIAMGAVLGICALTRGQEKIARLGTDHRHTDQHTGYHQYPAAGYQSQNYYSSQPGYYSGHSADQSRHHWRSNQQRYPENQPGFQTDMFSDQNPRYQNPGHRG